MKTQVETISVDDYAAGIQAVYSHLAHGWELHAAVLLTPAEERTMVREPAQAIPDKIAARVGPLRILVVPFIACFKSGDAVSFTKPDVETHSAVWLENSGRTDLILASKEFDAHDTGFEFLATVAQLIAPKVTRQEMEAYSQLIKDEIEQGVRGEIDQDALDAKQAYLSARDGSPQREKSYSAYRESSLVSTLAEYMHGLWHDVQIRVGPEHLPVAQLRHRMTLLAEWFPPNSGYELFARELERNE
jgi:hypothetical protein